MRILVPLGVRRSHRVITDSEATKRDVVAFLKVPEERIDVVHLGHGSARAHDPLGERELRERFDLGDRRVLLSLSAKRKHKNLAPLLDGFAALQSRPVLILAGYPTDHERELQAQAQALGIADDVRWPAWLSPAEVDGLWAITSGFVFPSLYEGFGLPILEAMARGVPVACSNTSATGEIAGHAAILFDPRDPAAIVVALERLLAGGPQIERLKLEGVERAAQFSWERTARGLLDSYARALTSR
jgi:glycosyltransferase involved in cell wall biosynthesis